jgi:hypothetical protein
LHIKYWRELFVIAALFLYAEALLFDFDYPDMLLAGCLSFYSECPYGVSTLKEQFISGSSEIKTVSRHGDMSQFFFTKFG